MLRYAFTLLLVITFYHPILAQEIPFYRYTTNDGLPSSTVYESFQDSRGFLWVATEFGACRYDGNKFKQYSVRNGLRVNDVWGFYEDSQNRLWIKSFSPNLTYIQKDSVHHIMLEESIEGKTIKSIVEDNEGNCWFNFEDLVLSLGTDDEVKVIVPNRPDSLFIGQTQHGRWFLSNRVFYRDDGKSIEKHPWPSNNTEKPIGLPQYLDGKWVIFFTESIVWFNPSNGRFTRVKLDSIPGIPPIHQAIYLMDNHQTTDVFWLGTSDGCYSLSHDLKTVQKNPFQTPYYFTHVTRDRDGNMWLSTGGDGLLFYPAISLQLNMVNYSFTGEQKGEKILAITNDSDGNWFMGAHDGSLYYQTANDQTWHVKTGLNKPVCALYYWNVGQQLIVGAQDGLISVPKSQFTRLEQLPEEVLTLTLPFDSINYINGSVKTDFYVENDTTLLIGTGASVIRMTLQLGNSPKTEILTTGRTYAISKERNGTIWLGRTNGLFYLKNGKTHSASNSHWQLKSSILDLCFGPDSLLYIATDGRGLLAYNTKTEVLNTIPGTENYIIKDVLFDKDHSIWIGTNQGIKRIVTEVHDSVRYIEHSITIRDGLISNEVNKLAFTPNRLLVATSAGISILHPKWSPDLIQPNIFVTGVKLRGRHIQPKNGIKLNHANNDVVIQFSSPFFNSRENLTYEYFLKGHSSNWLNTSVPSVTYHNLSPGSYEFLVRPNSPAIKKMTPEASWHFSISPHFTQTLWFKSSIALLSLLVVTGLLFWRIATERRKSKLLVQLSNLQAKALQARLNPHFVFNSLNSIQYLVGAKRVDDATEYLAVLAGLIRANFDLSSKLKVALYEELDALKAYIELEQMRFQQLEFSINVDDALNLYHSFIPPLVLQPFVENAILHGIRQLRDEKGLIEIFITTTEAGLLLSVVDNGLGFRKETDEALPKEKHQPKGISLIAQRLNLLFGKKKSGSWVSVSDRTDGKRGTQVEIRIPRKFAF